MKILLPHDDTFINKSKFEPARYFNDIIGITTTEDPVQEIVLRVTQDFYKYLDKVKLHSSQCMVEENETHVIVKLHVKNNYELKSTILSHGRYKSIGTIKLASSD